MSLQYPHLLLFFGVLLVKTNKAGTGPVNILFNDRTTGLRCIAVLHLLMRQGKCFLRWLPFLCF